MCWLHVCLRMPQQSVSAMGNQATSGGAAHAAGGTFIVWDSNLDQNQVPSRPPFALVCACCVSLVPVQCESPSALCLVACMRCHFCPRGGLLPASTVPLLPQALNGGYGGSLHLDTTTAVVYRTTIDGNRYPS